MAGRTGPRPAPILIEFVCITLMFRVVPHHTVKWRHAIPGAILAAVILELVKWGIGAYLGSFQSYQKLYGTVASSCRSCCCGSTCAGWRCCWAHHCLRRWRFRYQPVELRLPQGYEFYGLLRLLGRFQHARAKGKGLADDEILRLEPMLTDSLLQDLICNLQDIDLLRRDERGEWLLSRDLDQVSLADLYECTQLRIPVAEQHLPYRDDSLGRAALAALDDLRLPLRERLKRKVSDIYTDSGDMP